MFKKIFTKHHACFLAFLSFMAIYYLVHLFTLAPWYDELYTYYSFISRGPIYAAIHWPVPNNHVCYSILSAILDYFGNPYIGLRGVSYLAAIANMILIYALGKKFWNTSLSLICVCLYTAIHLVNNLAIQGRGYTFTITCYLVATYTLYLLCVEHGTNDTWKTCQNKKNLFLELAIFSISLTLGLYAIPSSLYWVLPTCFVGGCYLLLQRQFHQLIRLIISSLIAAMNTFLLYAVIWLAIGANLVSKDPESIYYGIYQITIIMKAPLLSLTTGMEYMLDTPYIQSIERKEMLAKLFDWCHLLFDQFYAGWGLVLTIVLCISLPLLCVLLYRIYGHKFKLTKRSVSLASNEIKLQTSSPLAAENQLFLLLYLMITLCMFPLILIIQSVLPYQRVFTYLGVFIAFLFTFYLSYLLQSRNKIQLVTTIIVAFLSVMQLLSPSQNISYGGDEEAMYETYSQIDMESVKTIFYTDDYQKYVLKFYWDLEPVEVALEDADCVLISKRILENKEQTIPQWPILYTYNDLPFEELDSLFPYMVETDGYVLYYKE